MRVCVWREEDGRFRGGGLLSVFPCMAGAECVSDESHRSAASLGLSRLGLYYMKSRARLAAGHYLINSSGYTQL